MEQNHCTTKTGKWKQLTERDRYKIEAYFQAGLKPQEIAAYIGCSKRTIERERRLGMTAQLKPATKNIKTCGDLQVQWVYLADVAQRRHEENAARKGRGLKIDKDHALARHIEHKIKTENGLLRQLSVSSVNAAGAMMSAFVSRPCITISISSCFSKSQTTTSSTKRIETNRQKTAGTALRGITGTGKASTSALSR